MLVRDAQLLLSAKNLRPAPAAPAAPAAPTTRPSRRWRLPDWQMSTRWSPIRPAGSSE